jgi:Protein of unknown function (DUF2946)
VFDLRPLFRRATWLALLAVLSMALLPTLSRAMVVASGGELTQICTPQGMKMVAVADLGAASDPTQPAPNAASLDHCPYCAASAGAAPLPVSLAPWHVPMADVVEAPRAFFQAPRSLFAWTRAQPRAPPVLS